MILSAKQWTARLEKRIAEAALRPEVRRMVADLELLRVRLELDGDDSGVLSISVEPERGLHVDASQQLADVVISGDPQAWLEVLDGEKALVRQVNVAHGGFTVQSDPVYLSWLMPLLSEVCAASQPGEVSVQQSTAARPTAKRAAAPAAGIVSGRYIESAGSQVYLETAGNGPCVILLHTAGRDARQWHPVLAELAGEFSLYAPDLPGRGRSEPATSGYIDNVEALASWVSGVADALGLESYLVAGCSLGGNLSLLLGAEDRRVRGVLTLQGADFTPTISASSLAMMDHPRVSLPHANMNFSMSLVGARADREAADLIRQGVRTINAPAQHADLTAYACCDTRDRMAEITCPVILFRGEDDWIVSAEMVRSTAGRLMNAAPLHVVSVPGVGHFPHVERPDLVAGLLRKLLALSV